MNRSSPFVAIDPATGEEIARVPAMSWAAVRALIERAGEAQAAWGRLPTAERVGPLRRLGDLLEARAGALAELMAREMGKPITAGRAEAEKCAAACRYYAEHAEAFLAPERVETEFARSYVAFRPLGVVLAIMPWNFPLWQVVRFAAPALAAGNGFVLKHAPNVPGVAMALDGMFAEAGFPPDLVRVLFIDHPMARRVIAHDGIAAVTLTGSTRAGQAVARAAGAHLKKTVLELGGSDPCLVLDDADLEQAAAACVTSRLINAGQSCIAAKRFIVVATRREAFESLVVERMREARMGDPRDPKTTLGPLARQDLREVLHRQVTESIARGATCLLGGQLPDGPGAFYPPTVLTDVRRGMPAFREELFGPVAAILPVANEAAAIRIGNASSYGLGAAVFTRDADRGEAIARDEVAAGSVFVNAFVRSDPRLPFGGIKGSGYGRELGRFGLLEFVNIKTIVVA